MTRKKGGSRQTSTIVRMPATKFAHLQKRLKKGPARAKKLTMKKTK